MELVLDKGVAVAYALERVGGVERTDGPGSAGCDSAMVVVMAEHYGVGCGEEVEVAWWLGGNGRKSFGGMSGDLQFGARMEKI